MKYNDNSIRKILVLAANPHGTARLRLDQEVREIECGLQRAKKRDSFIIKQVWAARPADVRRAMLDVKPNIVHFCGHGTSEGLAFENDLGESTVISTQALTGFFKLFSSIVDCIVLNACYSEYQALEISKHIDYVIGMRTSISDSASIEFSIAFYDSIGCGESIEFSYAIACNAIEWLGVSEELTPILHNRKDLETVNKETSETQENLLFSVPYARKNNIFGRENDFNKLHSSLIGNPKLSSIPVGIIGMAGVGKTQLVVEYAYRYQRIYAGGIFWLTGSLSISKNLVEIWSKFFACKDESNRNASYKIDKVVKYLKQTPNCLLIIDNLEDHSDLMEKITPEISICELPCFLVFTSRVRPIQSELIVVDLKPLNQQDSISLLRSVARIDQFIEININRENTNLIEKLCSLVGNLPLGIEILGLNIKDNLKEEILNNDLAGMNAEDDLDSVLEILSSNLWKNLSSRDGFDSIYNLEHVIKSHIKLLETEDSLYLLKIASQFSESFIIDTEILELVFERCILDSVNFKSRYSAALHQLYSCCLIEKMYGRKLRLHPLIRTVVLANLSDYEIVDIRVAMCVNITENLSTASILESNHFGFTESKIQDYLHIMLKIVVNTLALGSKDDRIAISKIVDQQSILLSLIHLFQLEENFISDQINLTLFFQQIYNRSLRMNIKLLADSSYERLRELSQPYFELQWIYPQKSKELSKTISGLNAWINDASFIPNSYNFISASEDSTIKVWSQRTGDLLKTLYGHSGPVNCIKVTSNGEFAISGSDDSTVKVWELSTGNLKYNFTDHSDWVRCIAISQDNMLVLSGAEDKLIKVRNLKTGETKFSLEGHEGWVRCIDISNDNMFVVSGSSDSKVIIWDLRNPKNFKVFNIHNKSIRVVKFIDSNTIISGAEDGTLKLFHIDSEKEVFTLSGHSDLITSIDMTLDKKYLISASRDTTIKVWNLNTGKLVKTLVGHSEPVRSVQVNLSNQNLLISSSWDSSIKLWNLSYDNDKEAHTIEQNTYVNLAQVLTKDYIVLARQDNSIEVIDLASGLIRFVLSGHEDIITSMKYIHSKNILISSSNDKSIIAWDLLTGEIVSKLLGHTKFVNAVEFDTALDIIFSASRDKTLRAWSMKDELMISTVSLDRPLVNIAVTSDSTLVVSDVFGNMYCFKYVQNKILG